MPDKVDELYSWLQQRPQGPIVEEDTDELSWRLADAWPEFKGGDASSTDETKISGRVDEPYWDDPRLSFDNERHGAFCQGSSRATINKWVVDLQQKTAAIVGQGHRQMTPQNAALNVVPIAKEIVEAILSGAEDNRVQWRKDRQSVRILTGGATKTGTLVPKQTQGARGKRLNHEIERLLNGSEWTKVRTGYFARRRPTDATE